MELGPVFLVLLDISGYTRFTTAHRTSVMHAEKIIDELLEGVIGKSSHPLVVHELLGDAVTFYVATPGTADVATEIRRQVSEIFDVFRQREAQLISECSLCNCEACVSVGKLTLKAILHFGQAVFTTVGGFQKLAGEDVILAHRLLKNSVPAREYVLETEPFYRLGGTSPYESPQARSEHPEGLAPIQIRVFSPFGQDAEVVPANMSLRRKIWTHAKIDLHTVARLLGKPAKHFRNFDLPQEETRSA